LKIVEEDIGEKSKSLESIHGDILTEKVLKYRKDTGDFLQQAEGNRHISSNTEEEEVVEEVEDISEPES
jgi:hypothetical protein